MFNILTNHDGKEYEKEYVDTYITESLCTAETQICKEIMINPLQTNINQTSMKN